MMASYTASKLVQPFYMSETIVYLACSINENIVNKMREKKSDLENVIVLGKVKKQCVVVFRFSFQFRFLVIQ